MGAASSVYGPKEKVAATKYVRSRMEAADMVVFIETHRGKPFGVTDQVLDALEPWDPAVVDVASDHKYPTSVFIELINEMPGSMMSCGMPQVFIHGKFYGGARRVLDDSKRSHFGLEYEFEKLGLEKPEQPRQLFIKRQGSLNALLGREDSIMSISEFRTAKFQTAKQIRTKTGNVAMLRSMSMVASKKSPMLV